MHWEHRKEQSVRKPHQVQPLEAPLHDVQCVITLGVLCGNKRLDERVGALRVEGEGITQRGQFRTFLHERLLQSVSSRVEVLLRDGSM